MNKKMDVLFANNELFEGIDSSKLLSMGNECAIKQGEYIIKEGEEANDFYVIKEGAVEVVKVDTDDPGLDHVIRELNQGDIFGEIGLIRNRRRTASVRALTAVSLIQFSLKKISIENAAILERLKTNLIELIVNRIENLYQQVDKARSAEIKRSRQLRFYQYVAILVLACCTLELGMILHYVYNKADFCSDINKAKNVPSYAPHMGL